MSVTESIPIHFRAIETLRFSTIAPNIFRVLFCLVGSDMVLLHGFQKKTQKTPAKEIALGRKRQKAIEG
jgi:phage-related protein